MQTKTITSKILNESYTIITADCGLTIACYPMPKLKVVHAAFGTNFGSVDRCYLLDNKKIELPAGVAHFLEHKMFENEDGDAFEKFAKTGANANAFTSFDKTCYVFSSTDNIDKALDILLSFVTTPYFTEQTVEKEQGIISQEIKMYDDSASWRALFGVLEGLYKNHYVKDDIAGTVESISKITPEMLYDCAKAFYCPSQMMLSVAGNITPQEVVKAVERAGYKSETTDVQKISKEEPDEVNYTQKTIKMSISNPLVAIGFKENFPAPISTKTELIGDIIMDVLTGSTSELFNTLYDENIVNGSFEGEIFSGEDYYACIISGETAKPEILIEKTQQTIQKLKKQGITQEQFQTSKNSIYGNLIIDFENAEEISTSVLNQYFKGIDAFSGLDCLAQITLQDVNEQLKKMFRDDKRVLFTILPQEEEQNV